MSSGVGGKHGGGKEGKEDKRKRKIGWRNGSVTSQLYKHEDLSSIPSTYIQMPGLVAHAHSPDVEEAVQVIPGGSGDR